MLELIRQRWTNSQQKQWGMVLLLLYAFVVYGIGLGHHLIPTNGDENVYMHITRITAENSQYLPLGSAMSDMRNTKPPLLFWQGMAMTHNGKDWSLWRLRLPNLIYTLLSTLLIVIFTRQWQLQHPQPHTAPIATNSVQANITALLAGIIYLSFFNTYRYGRPFLTNAPEIFWLLLPILFFWLYPDRLKHAGFSIVAGIVVGVGLLYKSPAMLLPVMMGLWVWKILESESLSSPSSTRVQRFWTLYKNALSAIPSLVLMSVIAIVVFGLWFILDPNPSAVWNEFIMGENIGKFDPQGSSYFKKLLWGDSSVWSLGLGFMFNAGLLMPPVIALFIMAFRFYRHIPQRQWRMWAMIAVFFLVFTLPSQRDSRYLLDVMPIVAILLALYWQKIPNIFFRMSLILTTAIAGVWLYLLIRLRIDASHSIFITDHLASRLANYDISIGYWILWGILGITLIIGFCYRFFCKMASLFSSLTLLLLMTISMQPFDEELGVFNRKAVKTVENTVVGVPCTFRASDESYRFLLPKAKIHGYQNATPSNAFSYVVVQTGWQEAPPCETCVLDSRLTFKSRHSSTQWQSLLHGQIFKHLFMREWLIYNPFPDTTNATINERICR